MQNPQEQNPSKRLLVLHPLKLMDVKKRYNYVKYLLKKLRVNNYYVKRKGNCFQRNFLKIKPIPIR